MKPISASDKVAGTRAVETSLALGTLFIMRIRAA